jgi:hypothetical protein
MVSNKLNTNSLMHSLSLCNSIYGSVRSSLELNSRSDTTAS